MSYNRYNQYSPYFQPEQDGRAQYQDGSRSAGSYQSSQGSYQPLGVYQSQQQQQSQSSGKSGGAYGNQDYGNTNGIPGPLSRSSSTNAHNPLDTSALGNLAYASTLRPEPSLQQVSDYGPHSGGSYRNNSAEYGINSAPPVSLSHQRADSRGSTTRPRGNGHTRASQGNQSPYADQASKDSSHSLYQRPVYNLTSGRRSPVQDQYLAGSRQAADAYWQAQYGSQQPRPSSGQAAQRSSNAYTQQAHSPQASSAHAAYIVPSMPQSTTANVSRGLSQAEPNMQQSATSGPTASTISTASLTPNTESRLSGSISGPYRQPKEANKRQAQSNDSLMGDLGPNPKDARKGSTSECRVIRNTSQQSTPVQNQHPATVNPNQIFNQSESIRRQAAAAAEGEAGKKATQATEAVNVAASTAPPLGDQSQMLIPNGPNGPNGTLHLANSESDEEKQKREQMELEMKQMIEKMRDYKSKDPSLFSQIWEQVKKGQPTQRAPSQAAQSSSTPVINIDQLKSLRTNDVQPPPESDLSSASPFVPHFDRGRYPMLRRKRGAGPPSSSKYISKTSKTHQSGTSADSFRVHEPSQAADHTPTPVAQMTVSTEDQPGNETLQRAVQQFHAIPGDPEPKQGEGPNDIAQPISKDIKPIATPAVSVQHSSEPAKQGTTYWPEHKKRVIADAAAYALTSDHKNSGKSIMTSEVHALLDTNPSYEKMCETLEKNGFVIDRTEFAQVLLSAIPDLAASAHASTKPANSSSIRKTSSNSAASQHIPRPLPVPQPPSRARIVPHPNIPAYARPNGYLSPYTPPLPNVVNDLSQRPTKQEMARKRSFGDIVDLTQASSDGEDYERHQPKPRTDLDNIDAHCRPSEIQIATHNRPESNTETPSSKDARTSLDYFRLKPSSREHLRSEIVVKPMNKKQDALRRSSYNPKTIAGDFLVATGKHPFMAPLNSHLDILRERFTSVNYDSDLSTFRWDLVDPGGEPAPVAEPPTLPDNVDADDADDEDAEDPAIPRHRPQVAVVIGGGDGTVVQGATEIGPLKRERQPKSRFNAPFRARTGTGGTADAPGGGTTGRSSGQQQNPQPSSAFTSLAGSRPPMPYDLQTPLPTRGVTSLFGHTPSFAHSSSQPSASTPKSRGRPPGAKNKNPRPEKGAPKKTSLSTDSQGNEVTPPLPRPRRVDSTPARPSGLRNALTPTDGIAVLIASPSPSVAGGGPGSKAKSKAPYVEEKSSDRHPSTPSYQIYKCLWKDCPAELHNLATLRKHVVKHGNQFGDGPFPCLWADCHDSKGAAEPGDSEQDKCPRLSFTSEAAWDRHIEGRHVNAIAWELGDGPSTRSSDAECSDYYSDTNGRRRLAPPARPTGRSGSSTHTAHAASDRSNFVTPAKRGFTQDAPPAKEAATRIAEDS